MKSKFRSIIVFLVVTVFFTAGGSAHDNNRDFPKLVKKMTPSVVGIAAHNPLGAPQNVLRGTGFVVYDGNYVITNAHVLPNPAHMTDKETIVVLSGIGRLPDVRQAQVVKTNEQHDLALLKIEGEPLPAVKLGNGAMLDPGTSIAFTGYPIGAVLGLYPVTHQGIVSAITPNVIPQPSARYLDIKIITQSRFEVYQLDATAYPGNSGSPLYDAITGRVEGVINSVKVKGTKENALKSPSGITFAIPAVYIHEILNEAGLKTAGGRPVK
ncbi:S1 family peptidase [Emcibacter nanhaiensis]|uniref:Trypsin-like peptidase domain-containing protein n=1 Tax=Emcibacter nanhaiensis TaxID=1505037 RepID=A0A501PBT0_9PROT|nr:serine protease [Emcibacter nanhaiensis]TPD57324.1 trypsin-like peptidase domain-containing protein [Emcibacter nanhaiensis]